MGGVMTSRRSLVIHVFAALYFRFQRTRSARRLEVEAAMPSARRHHRSDNTYHVSLTNRSVSHERRAVRVGVRHVLTSHVFPCALGWDSLHVVKGPCETEGPVWVYRGLYDPFTIPVATSPGVGDCSTPSVLTVHKRVRSN